MVCVCRTFVLCVMMGCLATNGFAQQTAPAPPAKSDDVLAVVNGHEIDRTEIEQFRQMRGKASGKPDPHQLMREIVTLELLGQEGKKQQIDQQPAVQAQIRMRTNNILARAVIRKYATDNIKITDDDIRKHYEASKEHYMTGEQITASHILVRTKAEALDVLKELRAGKDFAEVAKARSIGPSASRGGALGTFGRGRMVKPFEAVAFSLHKGELGGPVQTQFGFHIIKVTDRTESRLRPLEEVRNEIHKTLMAQRIEAFLDELLSHAEVQIRDPQYAFE